MNDFGGKLDRHLDNELARYQAGVDADAEYEEAKESFVIDNLQDRRARHLIEDGEMAVAGAFEALDPAKLDWVSLQSLLLSHVSGRNLYSPEYSMAGRLMCDILTQWLDYKCEPELEKEFDNERK